METSFTLMRAWRDNARTQMKEEERKIEDDIGKAIQGLLSKVGLATPGLDESLRGLQGLMMAGIGSMVGRAQESYENVYNLFEDTGKKLHHGYAQHIQQIEKRSDDGPRSKTELKQDMAILQRELAQAKEEAKRARSRRSSVSHAEAYGTTFDNDARQTPEKNLEPTASGFGDFGDILTMTRLRATIKKPDKDVAKVRAAMDRAERQRKDSFWSTKDNVKDDTKYQPKRSNPINNKQRSDSSDDEPDSKSKSKPSNRMEDRGDSLSGVLESTDEILEDFGERDDNVDEEDDSWMLSAERDICTGEKLRQDWKEKTLRLRKLESENRRLEGEIKDVKDEKGNVEWENYELKSKLEDMGNLPDRISQSSPPEKSPTDLRGLSLDSSGRPFSSPRRSPESPDRRFATPPRTYSTISSQASPTNQDQLELLQMLSVEEARVTKDVESCDSVARSTAAKLSVLHDDENQASDLKTLRGVKKVAKKSVERLNKDADSMKQTVNFFNKFRGHVRKCFRFGTTLDDELQDLADSPLISRSLRSPTEESADPNDKSNDRSNDRSSNDNNDRSNNERPNNDNNVRPNNDNRDRSYNRTNDGSNNTSNNASNERPRTATGEEEGEKTLDWHKIAATTAKHATKSMFHTFVKAIVIRYGAWLQVGSYLLLVSGYIVAQIYNSFRRRLPSPLRFGPKRLFATFPVALSSESILTVMYHLLVLETIRVYIACQWERHIWNEANSLTRRYMLKRYRMGAWLGLIPGVDEDLIVGLHHVWRKVGWGPDAADPFSEYIEDRFESFVSALTYVRGKVSGDWLAFYYR